MVCRFLWEVRSNMVFLMMTCIVVCIVLRNGHTNMLERRPSEKVKEQVVADSPTIVTPQADAEKTKALIGTSISGMPPPHTSWNLLRQAVSKEWRQPISFISDLYLCRTFFVRCVSSHESLFHANADFPSLQPTSSGQSSRPSSPHCFTSPFGNWVSPDTSSLSCLPFLRFCSRSRPCYPGPGRGEDWRLCMHYHLLVSRRMCWISLFIGCMLSRLLRRWRF